MRIGLVVPGFSADADDWCIPALRHLARCLARSDDVRVIAIRYPYRAARYTIDGAETIAVGGAIRRGAATFDLWRTALRLLHDEHRRRPFDVLHAFWATESGLLAAIAGRQLHVPTLVSLAGGELVALRDIDYGDQRRAWERVKVTASLRLASGVSAGSQQLKSLAEAHLTARRGRPRRVHIAPLGVDLDLFTPGARVARSSGARLLHVGALTPVKDQALLLRAVAGVRAAGVSATLEIVGAGPLRAPLTQLARGLGLDRHLCFRGELDHAALPAVYRAADVAVVSSRHEAQCMAALEAAACGIPVVGACVGMLPELTTALAPVGDADALASTIRRCLANPPAALSLHDLRATYGLEPCADRFRALYARP
ncbi:MAG: glycosyltransferase [Chloroflexi bacterium]|nr:glycosyltransferase [Chloroflexota bacterium]